MNYGILTRPIKSPTSKESRAQFHYCTTDHLKQPRIAAKRMATRNKNSCDCLLILQKNPSKVNSEGKQKTVSVSEGLSYPNQLNIQCPMLIIIVTDFSALQCIVQWKFTCFIRNGNMIMHYYDKRGSVCCTNYNQIAVVLVQNVFTNYTKRKANGMTPKWSYRNQYSSYWGTFQRNFDQGKGKVS